MLRTKNTFKVGDLVQFRLIYPGTWGYIVEDRGALARGGRHLYLVRAGKGYDDIELELPADELESVPIQTARAIQNLESALDDYRFYIEANGGPREIEAARSGVEDAYVAAYRATDDKVPEWLERRTRIAMGVRNLPKIKRR